MKNPVKLEIDNKQVTVPAGSTVLAAAEKLDIKIPTLCHLNGYDSFTSCMICVVHEIDSGRLVPACSQPVSEGMRISTNDEKVKEARKDTLEFLLSEHVGDCEAPCRRACPANMDIPQMIRLIEEKRFAEAIRIIKKDIALPAVLGRICPAPCEKACNRKQVDGPVSICTLKRFAADVDLDSESVYLPEIKKKSGQQAAIIGAGPAGLSAAYYLLQEGHDCVIYDQNKKPGGMLRYGVPAEQLPEEVLDAEIRQIAALGVTFRMEQALGKDIRLDELKNKYDAVVLVLGKIDPELSANSGLELSKRGIVIDKKTFATTLPGVFAGGNAVAESRMAIRALAHGKDIAYSVDQFLKNIPVTGRPRRFDSRMGKIGDKEIAEFLKEAGQHKPVVPKGGFETGYTEPEAVKESARCMHCDCRKPAACRLRRFAEEYDANQGHFKIGERRTFRRIVQRGGVIYEPGKCIKCGLCVRIAKEGGETFGLAFAQRGFAARVEIPFNEPLDRALEKTAAECIAACPTGALAYDASGGPLFEKSGAKTFHEGAARLIKSFTGGSGGPTCVGEHLAATRHIHKNQSLIPITAPRAAGFKRAPWPSEIRNMIINKLKILLLIVVLLFGCSGKEDAVKKQRKLEAASWPIYRGDAGLSGVSKDEIPGKPVLLWTFQTGGEILSSPVIGSGKVYIGSTDGKVYAINLRDGGNVWEFDTGDDIEAPPLLANNVVYIGNLSGDFFALQAQSGRVLWKAHTEGPIHGSANRVRLPDTGEELILVGSHDNKMYCFAADNDSSSKNNQKFYGGSRGAVFQKSPPGSKLKQENSKYPTGRLKWFYETDHFINGAPATDGEHIIFGGCDEMLHVLTVRDGAKIGEVPVGSYIPGSAALVDNRAYVGHYGSKLVCIDVREKKILWEYRDKEHADAFFSSPAVGKDYVVIGSRDGYVHCVNRETGEKVWDFRTRDDVDSSPVITGSKVIAASADGRLYVLSLEDGRKIWSYEIGAAMIGCPAAAGGLIVVGAEDGRLYTFGEGS